jgi:hypothetical protein
MFSNDIRKVGTSIKLQSSVITCINSGIVTGLFLNTLFFRYGKQNNQGKLLVSAFFFIFDRTVFMSRESTLNSK